MLRICKAMLPNNLVGGSIMSFAIIFKSSTGKLVIKTAEGYTEAKEVQDNLAALGISSEIHGM